MNKLKGRELPTFSDWMVDCLSFVRACRGEIGRHLPKYSLVSYVYPARLIRCDIQSTLSTDIFAYLLLKEVNVTLVRHRLQYWHNRDL